MNKQSTIRDPQSAVAVVGAGPAGSSLAIRLANEGFSVTLIERETFPRHKLCGEFISPECLRHFDALGVLDEMLAAGGERIFETHFYDRKGNGFSVPSSLLDDSGFALSLSRSKMDSILLEKARAAGVEVLEGTRASEAYVDNDRLAGLRVIGEDQREKYVEADLFVDATGRSSGLSKLVDRKRSGKPKSKPQHSVSVGFKNHFSGVKVAPGTCEIFFFPGGYGGLTSIENGLVNLCFLMDTKAALKIGSSADKLLEHAVSLNTRASAALRSAKPVGEWLAVSISSFGRSEPTRVKNLFAVGDSAAFIDPFTGSGMLMALESSSLLGSAIARDPHLPQRIAAEYGLEHKRVFGRRLMICSMLRRAAFVPIVPAAAIRFLSLSKRSRNYLAGSTRSARPLAAKMIKPVENQ